jgi:hypothetical protein
MQDLSQPDPAQQSAIALYNSFMAIGGQDIAPSPPTVAQSAGTIAIGVQENVPPPHAGAVQQPLLQPGPAAQPPAAGNTGSMIVPGQEMQVAQPNDSRKRKWGEDALAPHEFAQENGRYKRKKSYGPQKHPQSKKRRVDHEPEQRHDSLDPGQPHDNQEPTVDTPQPASRPRNRQGAIKGRQQALKWHRRRCLNPAAGCEEDCELREKHFDRYEQLRNKSSNSCPHLPPEHQNELWEHVPPPQGYVPQ